MPTRREFIAQLTTAAAVLPGAPADATPLVEFDDAELRTVLSQHERGLIYVWSPHMPYSVQGLIEILELGGQHDLHVVALLDPFAERALVLQTLRQHGLPGTASRRVRSPQLLTRGVTLHYPALLVFHEGALDDQLLPGYTTPAAYLAFIESRLARIFHEGGT